MPYTCQTCTRRKVKCDKLTPTCSSCRRGKLECFYQAPRPRKRKLSPTGGNTLPDDNTAHAPSGPANEPHQETISLRVPRAEQLPSLGTLLSSVDGKSRYINSNLWHALQAGDEEGHYISDEHGDASESGASDSSDGEDDEDTSNVEADPLTQAFMGPGHQRRRRHKEPESLLSYHPPTAHALQLWKTYSENVEPLVKILHTPSTAAMVEAVSRDPATATRADECLLFAIYHFAIFSMTEEECAKRLPPPEDEIRPPKLRATLLRKYNLATRQALVNASFLKTTSLAVLQALVIHLLACRDDVYDPHTFWILTGVAVRIAQRMGLDRDGDKFFGLPPFEVEMRRRVFYQLMPLDGGASLVAGTTLGVGGINMPATWDTRPPHNIDDSQIWPGMTAAPVEKSGATDMMFVLSRAVIAKIFIGSSATTTGGENKQKQMPLLPPVEVIGRDDYGEAERSIRAAESEIEERFVRYCDVVDPLHFLTLAAARCGITAMRLRIRMARLRNLTTAKQLRRELFDLAIKIFDTDSAACAHAALRSRFRWHIRPFFLWGSWDALILLLTTFLKLSRLLSPEEIDRTWARIEQVYTNHSSEFIKKSKRALCAAFRRLTLKAWDSSHPSPGTKEEPEFIRMLRALEQKHQARRLRKKRRGAGDNTAATVTGSGDAVVDAANNKTDNAFPSSSAQHLSGGTAPSGPVDPEFGFGDNNMAFDFPGIDFDGYGLGPSDWIFWD
ncbi:putative C6 transcription factor [Apodospora peruviana]|uniref:C6 transcription factor n=1 Tax=Apodospora peruviana TaxID=516989 RepID=A0AAE0M2M5_9PEZI|nr:putative C6 transcription factor [Apodospora peruviana]